ALELIPVSTQSRASGIRHWVPAFAGTSGLSRRLTEQDGAHFRIIHVDGGRCFDADRESAFDRRPRANGLKPAPEVRELRKLLPHAPGEAHPTHARYVGNRITAGEKFVTSKARVHNAEQPIDLVGVAVDGVGDLLRRVEPEVIGLARHRSEPTHLPEQPLVDGDAGALVARIELAGLASEILQNGAGFED